jgi:hypothetical protein
MGEHYFDLLHSTLVFPSYRTAQEYRKELHEEMGVTENTFDGTLDNIKFLIRTHYTGDSYPTSILAIDAASVTPDVRIKPNGEVLGLVHPLTISQRDVSFYTSNPDAFARFMHFHQNSIVKGVFVIMLIPVDRSQKAFPICCIPVKHSTATADILNALREKVQFVAEAGVKVAGIATDGDKQYVKFSLGLFDNIFNNISDFANGTLSEIFKYVHAFRHFSDPFHLVKRDRNRKVSGKLHVIDPWNPFSVNIRRDLEILGIPPYLLSCEQVRRMEDSLPKMLFTAQNLNAIADMNNPLLFFAMLPSTLLLESIHSDCLSRQERIDLLMIGACLMILYGSYRKLMALFKYEIADVTYTNWKDEDQCFTNCWCCEFISSCLSIVELLGTEETLHTGACGTHILEHCFGGIRRHSGGDDTHARFMKSIQRVLLEQKLLDHLSITPNPPSRRSDSGFLVEGDFPVADARVMNYLETARGLLGSFMNIAQVPHIFDFANPGYVITIQQFAAQYLQFESKIPHFASPKMTGQVGTGGTVHLKRWKADQQMEASWDTSQ